MALNIDPASIAEALRKNVESWTPSVERGEVGRVIETGDGIARVQGLPREVDRSNGLGSVNIPLLSHKRMTAQAGLDANLVAFASVQTDFDQ